MLSRQAILRAARTAAPQRAVASQVRFYAAPPAANNDIVKPPVTLFGLDGTYATALVRAISGPIPSFESNPRPNTCSTPPEHPGSPQLITASAQLQNLQGGAECWITRKTQRAIGANGKNPGRRRRV